MTYLDSAMRLAHSRGYLPLRKDALWLRELPRWLEELQTPDGMRRLEERLENSVPASLHEFWRAPELVRLLDSWRWQDFLNEQPKLIDWGFQHFIMVCSHPHSGGIGAVAADEGEDPALHWGWEDEDICSIPSGKLPFSEFVYLSIKDGPGNP